jgi:hypothetical protein
LPHFFAHPFDLDLCSDCDQSCKRDWNLYSCRRSS